MGKTFLSGQAMCFCCCSVVVLESNGGRNRCISCYWMEVKGVCYRLVIINLWLVWKPLGRVAQQSNELLTELLKFTANSIRMASDLSQLVFLSDI